MLHITAVHHKMEAVCNLLRSRECFQYSFGINASTIPGHYLDFLILRKGLRHI